MKVEHVIGTNTEIRREHGPGRVQLVDLSNLGEIDLRLELARYDELPVAAAFALELLRAAGECDISDEPSTRARALELLTDLAAEADRISLALARAHVNPVDDDLEAHEAQRVVQP